MLPVLPAIDDRFCVLPQISAIQLLLAHGVFPPSESPKVDRVLARTHPDVDPAYPWVASDESDQFVQPFEGRHWRPEKTLTDVRRPPTIR